MQKRQKRVAIFNNDPFGSALIRIFLEKFDIGTKLFTSQTPLTEAIFLEENFDVALLDLDFDIEGAVPLLEKLRVWSPSLGAVMLTNFPDLRFLGFSIRELPQGTILVLKRDIVDLNVLLIAIFDSIASVEKKEKTHWISEPTPIGNHPQFETICTLSSLQMDTLRLVAGGLSNSEIAKVRDVSEKSVEHMIGKLAQVLGLQSNAKQNLRVLLAREFYRCLGVPHLA
ncbi:unannotated protein [freshwater metagenome]|uniref:Unannotated protein n=1 Tax=freshwater metagenome TaxID=449393 RepID=A0A6J7XWU0_9ZZZZ|nr:hypothetical protein [Actinomycetota bacterium]